MGWIDVVVYCISALWDDGTLDDVDLDFSLPPYVLYISYKFILNSIATQISLNHLKEAYSQPFQSSDTALTYSQKSVPQPPPLRLLPT